MNTIMIVAGESSGELYGSLLAKTLRRRQPDVHIIGVGGERMKEAGVELVSRISDAFGLIEAVSALNKIKAAFDNSVDAVKKFRPDVLVLIDYPDFNLKLAKAAKSFGIKILYYVSPQVWAWRKGRVKKIAALVDRMAVILPFEEKIYGNAGLQCEFVGHPILEEIEGILETEVKNSPHFIPTLEKGGKGGLERIGIEVSQRRPGFKSSLGFDPERPLLSILPGSRPSELNRHLPLMVEVIRQIRNDPEIHRGRNFQVCMPLAPNTDEERYASYLKALRQEGVILKKGETVKALAASDMAVVTSGTATLQTAFLEVPMVVVYKLSPLTYHLGKRIIRVKHISLVNILSGREVVAELIQQRANPAEVVKEIKNLMFDSDRREDMLQSFRRIKEPFSGKNASDRVAKIVMEMAGEGNAPLHPS
jgi:lipid-A-disaccharide synthase